MSQTDKSTDLSRRQREQVLAAIINNVLKSHFNFAGVDYDEWQADLDRRRPDLLEADIAGFEQGVQDWLKGLKSSHTAFYHGQYNRFLPQHTINATVEEVQHEGRPRWRLLDVFPDGPADKAGLREGDVLIAANGIQLFPPELSAFSTGQTHNFEIWTVNEQKPRTVSVTVPYRKGTNSRPPIVEPRAITASMEGDSGTLKIPYFSGSVGLKFMRELATEMERFRRAGVSRLVLDLRGNIGGSLGFAGLASYLCPDRRPIGFSLTLKTLRDGYNKNELPRVPMPKNSAEFVLTMGKFLARDKSVVLMTQGLGPQGFHGNVVLKVNRWTNSAGEMLASFAQENGLAKLIGEKTAGNVLGAANIKVGNGYWVRFPVFGWMTWSGECLEGLGVTPR